MITQSQLFLCSKYLSQVLTGIGLVLVASNDDDLVGLTDLLLGLWRNDNPKRMSHVFSIGSNFGRIDILVSRETIIPNVYKALSHAHKKSKFPRAKKTKTR